MEFKNTIRKRIEKLTGRKIYRHLPFGIDPLYDIKSRIPGVKMDIVFDVGANIGQSAIAFKEHFPNAHVYCFEPVSTTFNELQKNVSKYQNITCTQIGFGDMKTTIPIYTTGHSDQNTFKNNSAASSEKDAEMVTIYTLDAFCAENNIKHIHYLKVDTEGFDLHVLKGAEELLEANRIDFIEVEAGMNPTNDLHVPLEELKKHAEHYGYYLFGLYEQVQEWKLKKPLLRRSNPLFVSSEIAQKAL